MTPENHTLFDWNTLDEYSDLKRLQMVFTSLPAGGLLDALCHMRSGGGRNDWPLQPMLKACIARIVYQHASVESFRRELQRNPSLMLACGFKLMACHNDPQRYRVPSKSAFSRFNRLMNRAERDFGAVSDMFDSLVKQVSQLLPDFGTHQGFDGKALKSHSTGNDIPGKGRTSDPDARWGKHEYHYTDQKGRAQKKVKSWFGYKLYLQADVRYELPIAFSLKPANETEIKECKELVSNMLENELAERCKSFVADKGLDADELRKIFYRHGVTTAIDVRRMWQEEAVDGLRYPTRSLNEDRVDTMRWARCTANARKPARFGRCRITDWRENAARRSFTVRCPTPVRCVPGVRSAIGSAVFAKMQNGASYASRSTRTSFAPLRRCRGTPIDGSGITKDAVHWSVSMPGSVATFSWNATICEGLKPCRCALR